MESHRDSIDLTAALQALRPTPRPDFAAELDARAAAGFPPRNRDSRSAIGRISERLRLKQAHIAPRRLLAPAGAFAVAAIAIGTAVVAINEGGPETSTTSQTATTRFDSATTPNANASGPTASPAKMGEASLPQASSGESLNEFSGPVQSEVPVQSQASSDKASSGANLSYESAVGTTSAPPIRAGRNDSGPYASQADRRAIERSAQLVLGTDPSEVRDDAAKVFETVHSYNGIVLRSSIRDGDSGEAGATFDLLIPTAKVGDALASFSEIAEVRSRHESTQDITAPTITVGEHLQDTRAKIEGLLAQLASADTDAERDAVEAVLRRERFRVAALRSRLTTLQRRANLSHVSLRIETGAAESNDKSDTGSWGVQDAVDDAGHILGVAAGVTVVGLAIVAPFVLIALLAWFARRVWVRRGREQALD